MNKVVKLSTPVEAFGQQVTKIELKEPKGMAFFRLGEPRVPVINKTGSGYYVEYPETIKEYLEHCVDHEMGGAIVNLLTLEDAMAVKEALFGFFMEAAERRSAARSTHSSSGQAS